MIIDIEILVLTLVRDVWNKTMIITDNIKIKVVIQPMSLFIERAYSWLSYFIELTLMNESVPDARVKIHDYSFS